MQTWTQRIGAIVLAMFAVAANAQDATREATRAHDYRDRNFDYFVSGDPGAPRASHTTFGLALMGGGGKVDAAFKFIADRGGHGHVVILGAVSDDKFDPDDGAYGKAYVTKWGPVTSAETIIFHNREASSDPRVLAILRNADGIFLEGGDQSSYIKYWKGTGVEDALNAHVKANRPIGGSSAGLAILGHYSYTALDGGSMESKIALGNPFDAGVTLETDFLRFENLESVITDTHFSARSRLGRLIAFVARLQKEHDKNVIGIGVDEHTALLVDEDGTAKLAAGSLGSAWLVVPHERAELVAGKPLTMRNIQLTRIDAKSTLDVRKHEVRAAGASVTLSIENGKLAKPSIASKMLMRDRTPPDES